MRIALVLYLVLLLVLASGCGSRQEVSPARGLLFTGKLEEGTFWLKPLTAASNEGGGYAKGSRVEVSHVHPHGYYSGLMLRKD